MSVHTAWRAAFAIVPVPILITVAVLTLVFGTDCPAGRWSDRRNLIEAPLSRNEERRNSLSIEKDKDEGRGPVANVRPVGYNGKGFFSWNLRGRARVREFGLLTFVYSLSLLLNVCACIIS